MSKAARNTQATLAALARSTIEHQAKVLANLASTASPDFDKSFEAAIQKVVKAADKGSVLTSGVGKAGLIARKVASTLASLGVPASFIDPTDAVHGDLGRLSKLDCLLLFSNSGETQELVQLIPFIQRVGVETIAITRSKNSTLGRHSSLTIELGTIEECAPLKIAPTASTTAMLAIGDAIAMAFAEATQLSLTQYSTYHPAGDIGRGLKSITEVMRSGDRHCIVAESATTRDVIHQIVLTPGRPGAASVVDNSGKLVGIFTDGNLRRLTDNGSPFLDSPISEVMTKCPKTIESSKSAKEAYIMLAALSLDQLIVVDDGVRPLGMVDIQDLAAIFTPKL